MEFNYYAVRSLSGGLNTRQDPSLIADNECVIAENVDFDSKIGSVVTRKRIRRLNSTALAGRVIGLYRYIKSTGVSYLIAETDDTVTRRIYYSTNNGSTFTLLTTRTTGYVSAFVDYEDWLYFTDLNDEAKRWNGTSLTKWGISAPGTAPTLTVGEAGNLTGTYKYKVTFLNAEGTESGSSPASAEITVSGQKINLSNIPTSPDGQVAKRRIYRFGGTLTDYYLVATINDNTTTTYTDNLPDTDVGALLDPYDRYPAPNAKTLDVHYNRIFAGNIKHAGVSYPHGFVWSRARRPENFYDPSDPDPAGRKGKEVVRVIEMGESIYFFTKETISALRGSNEDTFYLDPTYVQMPCQSGLSVCRIGTAIGYLGLDGYYLFNGLSSRNVSDKVRSIFVDEINTDEIEKISAVYDQKHNRLYIIYPEGSAVDPDKILIFDLTTNSFCKWLLPATTIYFDHELNRVLIGSSTGYVYELESDSPTETNFTFKWRSKAYDFGVPETYKTLYAVRFTIKTNAQNVTVNLYKDSALYGYSTFATDGDWTEIREDAGITGKNFQIEITG
ncbi:MAG: hypothetical protein QW561_01680, partial [Candidatus Aenigmatarchaeota archaeon]